MQHDAADDQKRNRKREMDAAGVPAADAGGSGAVYAAESAAIKGLPQGLLRQCLLSGLQFGVKDVKVCDGIGIFE